MDSILSPHNKPLPTMSPSNPHISTQIPLTATYLASATNSSHISQTCRMSIHKSPMVSRALKWAKHCIGKATSHKLPLTVDNINTVYYALELIPCTMMFCLRLNSSLALRIYFVWVNSAGLTKSPYEIIVKWPCGIRSSFLMIILVYFCLLTKGMPFLKGTA